MIFNSEKVRKYILSGAKQIATIRKKGYYQKGRKVVLKLGERRLMGKVIDIAPISTAERFVRISGFNSVEEWLSEAKRLHKGNIDESKFEIIVVEITQSPNC